MSLFHAMPSPNWNDRPAGQVIDLLILHYTGMVSAAAALARLCDPAAEVSAHYLIDEDGTVYALVEEQHRAWHAGKAFWRGDSAINSRSIGIELVNPGHEFGYRPFPEAQMVALIALCHAILARHPIPPRHVLGHSDVAPLRKQDPGELFDWARLAAQGIGVWPDAAQETMPVTDDWRAALSAWGYATTTENEVEAATRAFCLHFRQNKVLNTPDKQCYKIINWLLSNT